MEEMMETDFEFGLSDLYADLESYVPAISSAALMDQEFTPAEFVVKGFLPKGLCVLGGAPKIGKSWMMLDLCLHVAKGEPFLGMEVKQGTAWYLSLEDTNDRIRQRLACITAEAVDSFQITTREHEPGTMADSLPKTIDKFMRKFPDTKLIVIDTMQMAKGTSKDPQYSGDYADTGAFKTIADKHKVAMVLITHLRKAADSDTFNEITGSTGITGAADTLMTLKKSARMADAAKLSCTGRDIAQREMELRFDKTNFVWSKISDSADLEVPSLPPEMAAFVDFMKTIGSYEGGNTALAEAFAEHSGFVLTPKVLKQKMNRWCCVLADAGVTFRSFDTNHGKMVSASYTPPTSHTSQISQDLGA